MPSLNRKNDEIKHLMNARTGKRNDPRPEILPEYKQEIFWNLHGLSGDDYQFELSKLKLYMKWDIVP